MDEDILAELDRQLTNVNLDKYWVRKVGDFELWLTTIDYTQSNRVKKVLEGEFGLEEAKRVTLSAAIVGVNGSDLRPLRAAGKTIKVRGRDGKTNELVDLPEVIYRKIANWDAEFIDVVFEVYSDIMESHKKDLVKEIVFENAKSPEAELEELEERAAALRERLGKPPLIEAQRLDLGDEPRAEDAGASVPTDEELEGLAQAAQDEGSSREPVSFDGAEEDFDPFAHVKAMRAQQAPPEPQAPAFVAQSAPPPVPVPVPSAPTSSAPSAIEAALAQRRSSAPISGAAPAMVRPAVKAHAAQPSVPSEVLEKGAARIVVDPPKVNPNPATQSKNPRFRNAGLPR